MTTSAAARRYARALFMLGKEDHIVPQVRGELDSLAELFAGSRPLRDALLTPLHPVKERKAVLRAVSEQSGISTVVGNFYSYLIDQRRLVEFAGIREEFSRLADEDAGLMTAEVIAATPLDDRRKDRLRRALSDRTGREVQLDIKIDPELIGGVIAKVGGMVFDGSLRAQLSQLRATLTREA
jgi:F-type H+-transporting ATPase subunit delta